MTLESKIFSSITAITLAFALILSYLSRSIIEEKFIDDYQQWAYSFTNTVAESISLHVINGDKLLASESLIKITGNNTNILYAYVTDFDGNLFAHSYTQSFPEELKQQPSNQVDMMADIKHNGNHSLRFTQPLIDGMRASIYLGISTEQIDNSIASINKRILLSAFLLIIISAAIAAFIGRKINKPLKLLSETIRQYGKGNRQIISQTQIVAHELKSVWKNFTDMAHNLEIAEKDLNNFKYTLDSTLDCVFMFDARTLRFFYVNEGARQQSGYTNDELLRMHPYDITPEFTEVRFISMLQSLLAEKQPSISFETIHESKNGNLIPVEIFLQYIHADNIQPRFVAIVRDITERKLTETKIANYSRDLEKQIETRTLEYKRAKEEAEFSNQAKSTFLSRMSHELRTPMNAILGFAQLMDMDNSLKLNPQLKDNLTEILNAGNHLLNLINEILDLARIESGKMTLSIEPVQFDLVLYESLPLLETLTNQHKVTIINNINHVLWLHVDRVRIKQIVINLMSNAIKYNRQGGTVTINAHTHDNITRIEITDTGYGIAEEHLTALFAPFERFTNAENTEGTGIGLNITKSLVELMGGRLGVDSTLNEGSTFWIEMENSREPEFLDNVHAVAGSSHKQQNHTPHVVYVDDNPSNQKLARRYMAHFPEIRLHVAATPSQGLALIKALSPDLVLLDINLPEMNGLSLMKLIRARHGYSIPLIATSANTMLRDPYTAQSIGFDDYLPKPVCFNNFSRILHAYLPISQQKKAGAA